MQLYVFNWKCYYDQIFSLNGKTSQKNEKTKNKNSSQGQMFNAINNSMGTAVEFVILMDSTRSKL